MALLFHYFAFSHKMPYITALQGRHIHIFLFIFSLSNIIIIIFAFFYVSSLGLGNGANGCPRLGGRWSVRFGRQLSRYGDGGSDGDHVTMTINK